MPVSNIWKFFEKLPDQMKAKCKECGKHLARTDGATSALNKHLSSIHPELFKESKAINEIDEQNSASSEFLIIHLVCFLLSNQ